MMKMIAKEKERMETPKRKRRSEIKRRRMLIMVHVSRTTLKFDSLDHGQQVTLGSKQLITLYLSLNNLEMESIPKESGWNTLVIAVRLLWISILNERQTKSAKHVINYHQVL